MNVSFLPSMKQVNAGENSILMNVMRENDILLDFVCGGKKTCGKCKVLITKGNYKKFTKEELELLTEDERNRGYRLACCFPIVEDTCVILENGKLQKKVQNKEIERVSLIQEAGIVFDIGTTTVESCMVLNHKTVLESITRENPQRAYGQDVISRISYGLEDREHCQRLHDLMIQCMNEMIKELMQLYDVKNQQILDVAVFGNTTMIYLFLNLKIDDLARGSFQNCFFGEQLKGKKTKLFCNQEANIWVPGLIGGHVGSDTLACIMAVQLWKRQKTTLMIDVGTNGEIVLLKNGKMAACSTAAGPAFEGANIKQGMRAGKGAIISAAEKEDGLETVIMGGGVPSGICGSGLIDVIAAFLDMGVLERDGCLGRENVFIDRSGKVRLWQQDVRQLQLAKSAIYSGIQILLRKLQIQPEEIDKIYIAGAFGNGINVENAVKIGLFPSIPKNKFVCIGNGVLLGGVSFLQGNITFRKCNDLAYQVEHIDLAKRKEFQEAFISNLNF